MTSFSKLLAEVKNSNQDFEWYPTTDEMIDIIKKDIENEEYRHRKNSILDCGAGDGRVLAAFEGFSKYAIEKSLPLISAMPKEITIVGSDFMQQTLIDKGMDVTFCNPPYSEYQDWVYKIITESNSSVLYFVIPSRWVDSKKIKQALEIRGVCEDGKHRGWKIIYKGDFLDGDRQARAKIDIVKVYLNSGNDSAFNVWFDTHFKPSTAETSKTIHEKIDEEVENIKSNKEIIGAGCDIVNVLENLYNRELEKLFSIYKAIVSLDLDILQELGVSKDSLIKGMKEKIKGLKSLYWGELFNKFEAITSRLTVKNRQELLDKMRNNTSVDFSAINARAIALWVINNAKDRLDEQLISTYEKMINQENIIKYKSNVNTFKNDNFRWSNSKSHFGAVYLDYRVVVPMTYGLVPIDYYRHRAYNGLGESAGDFLQDVRTVAHNLGFSMLGFSGIRDLIFHDSSEKVIYCLDLKTGEEKELFRVRAYKNGNIHLKFHIDFIKAWSIEFGRLMGWLRSPKDAVNEIEGVTEDDAERFFSSSFKLPSTVDNLFLLENK